LKNRWSQELQVNPWVENEVRVCWLTVRVSLKRRAKWERGKKRWTKKYDEAEREASQSREREVQSGQGTYVGTYSRYS
jgi:primase-polymerase (primpol)-like protein